MRKNRLIIAAAQMVFRASIEENVNRIVAMIGSAAGAGADVVLFPECAVTGYNCDFAAIPRKEIESGLKRVAQAARQARCNVLVGCPTYSGRKRLNSLVIFDRRGREVFRYSKIHLTARDARFFSPGNKLAYFHLDGVPCTAIICHERRFPELVRLPVMLGAQIVFHPNAGLDALAVSRTKRKGRDGAVARAFENQIFYVFANSVGPQGDGLWSAGDSKIVGPDCRFLALADNRSEKVIVAEIDLARRPDVCSRSAATTGVLAVALEVHAFRMPAAPPPRIGSVVRMIESRSGEPSRTSADKSPARLAGPTKTANIEAPTANVCNGRSDPRERQDKVASTIACALVSISLAVAMAIPAARVLAIGASLGVWFWTQWLLGRRSLGPKSAEETGPIRDGIHRLTARINRRLNDHPRRADALLISSSLVIDLLGFYLLGSAIMGPTIEPFLGL